MEEKRFVLYEYLLYFWKRKLFFIIVPLITTLLVASAVYVLKHDKKYTGVATVFTGTVNAKDLTDPVNIKAKYKEIKDLDVFVSEKGHVKFTVNGNSQVDVQKDLAHITKSFSKELDDMAKLQLEVTNNSVSDLEDHINALNDSINTYKQKQNSNQIDEDQYNDLSFWIINAEEALAENQTKIDKKKSDLVFFEMPKVLSESVHPKKTYLPESIAIGMILGVVFTIALLMLLKYLGDARRYYKHD